jgi:hypothetical protein
MRALSIIVCSALGALALAAAALGEAGASSIQSAAQHRVTVDRALIARHHALALLGESHVFTDPAVIGRHRALGRLGQPTMVTDPRLVARHQALGRLPDLSASGARHGPAAGSSTSFPWKEIVIGFCATAAALLVGFGVRRSHRVPTRGAA